MSDDIYDDAFGTETERMEMIVDIYESVDHVRDHDFRTKIHQPLQRTDGQIYQSSFYFVSSESKSWTESRRFCTERGADLTIINNREEQEFIKKISGGAGVWIGVTDSDVEGRWKWVDDTLTSGFSFWGIGEPNGGRRENCVASYPTGWYDYPCSDAFKWICEKIFKK
ncbi:C-type lectin domain family 4 member E-like isoform X2 [Onychostoma macrolepis]|uniref:C-type lectin domain family 4 member E-like isoform X2 n=1 Tax=Onychostoma macrolepis TaxID=369639 RepID=UPI00272C8B98|nr:C-type lectin domain family 4 member E-like isoform X2 [Onychostoma macrolepis]